MRIIADMNIPFVAQCFSSLGSVQQIAGREMTPQSIAGAEILLVRSVTQVNSALLGNSKVKFVGTATIGVDHIDLDYLEQAGIGFSSAPGSNANSVAEYVTSAILNLARDKQIELKGKRVGIIGHGNVGKKVEKKIEALGMTTVLNDPPLFDQTGDTKYKGLEEIYDCDFITMHTPLTKQGPFPTENLADSDFFSSLTNQPVFINTSRGGVVEETALKQAIESGTVSAAVLDVWRNEPSIDIELLKMVDLASPHIAGYSLDGKIAGMYMIYQAACEYFSAEPKYVLDDFLPAAAVPEIFVSANGSEAELLLTAVNRIYDIKADDETMRKMLDEAENLRAIYFDNLRKDYPARREFQNTTVTLDSAVKQLAGKFSGLGFKIKE